MLSADTADVTVTSDDDLLAAANHTDAAGSMVSRASRASRASAPAVAAADFAPLLAEFGLEAQVFAFGGEGPMRLPWGSGECLFNYYF